MDYPLAGKYFGIDVAPGGDEYILCGDQVVVVAQDDDGLVFLISEPSVAFADDVLLLPGGSLRPGEDPLVAANRELQEEIGYRARDMRLLCRLRPFSKYLRVTTHVCLARDLVPDRLVGDEAHVIVTHRLPVSEIDRLLAAGGIADSTVVAALLLWRRGG